AAITKSKYTRFRNRSAGDRREWTPTRWGSSWRSPRGSSARSCWSPGCFGRGSTEPGPSTPRRFRKPVVSSDRVGHPCDLVSGTRINLPDRKHRGPRFNMTTTVGIRSKDGVVLAADKRASKGFMSSGSGSPIAYGVLEQGFRKEFSLDEARKLAEAAVRAAMERDPGSGNGVDVLAIPNGHSLEVN